MKKIIAIPLLLFLLLPSIVLAASNISNSLWYGLITISNNSTAATNVATTANISTPNFIADNYLNASANNCAMRSSSGADVRFMPGYTDANLWSMWVPSIGANSHLTYILYTANSTGGEIRYFPAAGGMTTTDNETLELGDNFTIEQQGWVDTTAGVNKTLVYKQGAFLTQTGAGNIRSEIRGGDFPTVAATSGGNDVVNSINHTVNIPAGISWGDLLLVFFAADENTVITFPSGWIELFQDDRGVAINFGAWYRIADGTEAATITVTTANAQMTSHTSYRITGYSEAPEVGVSADNNNATPNPPDLVPSWGALNTLWFASTGYNGDETVNAYPANYTNGRNDRSADADGCGVGTARRERNIAAENPGTFTLSGARDWVANTVAIAPAISVTATGVSSGNMTVKTDTSGNVTGGLDFDGASGDITVPDQAAIQNIFDGGGTIECWINPDSDGEINFGFIASKVAWDFLVQSEAAGKVKIRLQQVFSIGGAQWLSTSTEIDINTWTHVVATYNNSATINNPIIYINGTSVALTETALPQGTRVTDVGSDLIIGNQAADDRTFDGTIDEMRFYTRIMGQPEVTINYNGGIGLKEPANSTNLVGHWRIDMGEGTVAYDEAVAANDGTITTATWTQGHIPSQFSISIDGVQQDGTRDAIVPLNAENWTFVENYSMIYLEHQEFTINGTQAQYIEWEYNDEFDDLGPNSNNATPTFRSASSDPDVTANMTAFLPVAEAKAPDYVLGAAPAFFTATPNITGNFTTVPPDPAGGFPLAGVIADIANATGTPPQLPLLIVAVFVILAASLSMSALMRKKGSGTLIVKVIVIVAFMGIFIALKNFGVDFWMLIVFLIIAVAMAMGSRQLGWQ